MAGVSASHLILFIASLVVAAGVAGTFTTSVGRVSDALSEKSLDVSTDVRTDVEIISDAGSPVYNISGAENVTLLVKNTGAQPLPVSHEGLDVLIDGRYQTNVTVTRIGGDGSYWGTNEVVKLAIHPEGLAPGDHRVKLIVNGDEEVFTFRVP